MKRLVQFYIFYCIICDFVNNSVLLAIFVNRIHNWSFQNIQDLTWKILNAKKHHFPFFIKKKKCQKTHTQNCEIWTNFFQFYPCVEVKCVISMQNVIITNVNVNLVTMEMALHAQVWIEDIISIENLNWHV